MKLIFLVLVESHLLAVESPSHTVDPLSPIFMPVFLDNHDFGFSPSQSLTDATLTPDMFFIFHLLFIYKNISNKTIKFFKPIFTYSSVS